jgi:putative membrane protein
MNIAAKILTAIVALEHLWFLVLEMFLWTRPIGMKTFGTTPEFAQASAVLAANQGLYNGFLAAGLIWALTRRDQKSDGFAVQVFFLSCVIVAGVYGGLTAKATILYVQAAPALLALILAVLARRAVSAPGARATPR